MPNEPLNDRQNHRANVMPADTPAEIADPQSNADVFYGSFSSILMQNLGQYVIVEFLIGTNRLEIKEGILYSAGINFLTLYDPIEDRYTVCDFYSVRFVTIYNTTTVPPSRLTQFTERMMGNSTPNGRSGFIPAEPETFANPDFGGGMSMSGMGAMNEMNGMNNMGGSRASMRRRF